MNDLEKFQPQLDRMQWVALIVGGVFLALCFLVSLVGLGTPLETFQAYLFSYIFWISIPLGCMAILMMHHLTGGWWGYPIRRLLEAGTRTFGVMALLFIPILLGMKHIYPWVNPPQEMLSDANYHFKLAYLSTNF